MRITESRIRRIIREEAQHALQEMPYAGNLGIVHSDSDEESSLAQDVGPNPAGAEKYARSGRFGTLALKSFATLPQSVWVAPFIGVGLGVSSEGGATRAKFEKLVPAGVRKLKKLGYEATDRVGADDTVILYTTMSTHRGFMATPWMIVHAIFDVDLTTASGHISPTFERIYDRLLNFGDGDEFEEIGALDNDLDVKRWVGALTMASARNGKLSRLGDALSEMICQEILTAGGLRLNLEAADPEFVPALEILASAVKTIGEEFRRASRGKLITVSVN